MVEQLKEDLRLKEPSIDKLVPNLHNETRYVVLQELVIVPGLGKKLTKVHRVLALQQTPWLKEYIISTRKNENTLLLTLKNTSSNYSITLFLGKRWKTCIVITTAGFNEATSIISTICFPSNSTRSPGLSPFDNRRYFWVMVVTHLLMVITFLTISGFVTRFTLG